MRIVLVNWARIWDGATGGGGVNGYCQALALRLARLGHEVISLCGGTVCTPGGACRIRRHQDWMGLRVFEVVNSPVLAPSIAQFQGPAGEVSSPELEAKVAELFAWLKPDVVHFHNIEGFTAGCVRAARDSGAGVLFSLHNYHTICPQVYLMQGHRVPCRSFDNGHNCDGCIPANDPRQERHQRIRKFLRESGLDDRTLDAPEISKRRPRRRAPLLSRLLGEVRGLLLPVAGSAVARARPEAREPGIALHKPEDATIPLPVIGTDARGKARYLVEELRPRHWPDPADPHWQPLDNDPTPEPPSDKPPNDYARRRGAMIDMLNGCDLVLPVSEFVRRKFQAMGVDHSRLRTLHIGTWVNEVVARHHELVFDPPPFQRDPARPLRLVFIGFNHWYKGLSMLADTLELLTPEYLRRIDLHVSALGGESIEWRFRRLEPRLARLTFHRGYEYHDIPWICGGKDLGLVPSVWWDNGPQTVLEFFACRLPVMGADLGGIPDFIRDGVNGILFRGNDRYDMARRLAGVIREPGLTDRLRANVRPPKGIDEHAREMEQVYAQCVCSRTGARAEPAGVPGAGQS